MRLRHEKAKSLCVYMWGKRGHICKPNSVYTAYDDDDNDDDSTSSILTRDKGHGSLDRDDDEDSCTAKEGQGRLKLV